MSIYNFNGFVYKGTNIDKSNTSIDIDKTDMSIKIIAGYIGFYYIGTHKVKNRYSENRYNKNRYNKNHQVGLFTRPP
jgi:hypothetical protein